MSIVDVIKGSPLFDELYDSEIDTIIENSSVLKLEMGDYIVRENDEGDEIFIILSGEAKVKKSDIELATLTKADLFGELVLLNERTRTADIIASEACDVLVIKYTEIFGLYHSNPKIFSLLILNLARLLTRRLKKTGSELKEVKEKLKRFSNNF